MTYEIVLRDLEKLLQDKFGNEVILLEWNCADLLPPGENYGSTIYKIDAIIQRNKNLNKENLHMVAKMLPSSDYQRQIFDSYFTFKKEIFFYHDLIPFYQNLEIDFGVDKNEVFNAVPEFFAARTSLANKDEVDDDAVILMDNLLAKNYYMGERRYGFDLLHARKAVKILAHFHALGMATKYQKPEYFEILKVRSKCLDLKGESFDDVIKSFLETFQEDPEMSKYYDRIKAAMTQESAKSWSIPPEEPWSTIVHSDFWVNNIMFQKNDSGNITDIKMIDFQNYLFMSPLRELAFFLTTGLNFDVMENHFDEIMNLYYENFISVLKRMKCDVSDFTRDKFDDRLKIDAFREFPHGPYMLKMMTAEVEKDFQSTEIKSLMRKNFANPLLIKRLRVFVNKFVEKGWL